jgi:hypothetical protein
LAGTGDDVRLTKGVGFDVHVNHRLINGEALTPKRPGYLHFQRVATVAQQLPGVVQSIFSHTNMLACWPLVRA